MRIRVKISKRNASCLIWYVFLLISFLSCKDNKNQIAGKDSGIKFQEDKGFVQIFDGSTLEDWEGDPTYWRASDGIMIGEVTPETLLKSNTFIIWKGGLPADFELKLEFRIAENGNSGINYRSERLDTIPYALMGYQADIDGKNTYTGQNYEERKRTTLAYRGEKVIIKTQHNPNKRGDLRANVKNNAWQSREVIDTLGHPDSLKSKIKKEDWNSCHLIIKDNRMQHYINEILMSEVSDLDTLNRKSSGHLGLQVHVGPTMKVEFRNIKLKEF